MLFVSEKQMSRQQHSTCMTKNNRTRSTGKRYPCSTEPKLYGRESWGRPSTYGKDNRKWTETLGWNIPKHGTPFCSTQKKSNGLWHSCTPVPFLWCITTVQSPFLNLAPTTLHYFTDLLSAFFNESLASGQLPEEFKSGLLLPIFKSGKTDSQKAENYRGISLTYILSKVLERIVHSQLCDHFQTSGTFSDSQYGFRRNHSCSDLLVSTIDDWLLARDRKLNTAIVFLDLKKAFDNVRHQNLLQCLQNAGIGGTVLRWIHHFLTDRYYQLPGNWPRWTPKRQQSTLHVQQRCPPGERIRTTLLQC